MNKTSVVVALLLGFSGTAFAAKFNTDALRAMQEEGKNIAEQAQQAEAQAAAPAGQPLQLPDGGCLTVQGETAAPGSAVAMAECNAAPDQAWQFDAAGRLAHTETLCLERVGEAETGVQLAACGDAPAQQWHGDAAGRIVSPASTCLQAAADGSGQVDVAPCSESPHQLWRQPTPAEAAPQ